MKEVGDYYNCWVKRLGKEYAGEEEETERRGIFWRGGWGRR